MPFSKSSKVRLRLNSRPFEDCEPLLQAKPVGRRGGGAGKEGMSQVDMAYNILASSGQPLHINEILTGIKGRFKTEVDRESLVSAISKRVARSDRFRRTGKNVFALLTGPAQ